MTAGVCVLSEMQPHFYKNIVVTGGNCLFPGFRERVLRDVRALAPAEFPVSVLLPPKYVFIFQQKPRIIKIPILK